MFTVDHANIKFRVRREVRLSKSRELAEAHWDSYVKKIVEAHEPNPEVVEKCGIHYVLTFIHGYKHGVESVNENNP